MAEATITILKVGTDEAVRNINDLKTNIKQLKDEISKLDIGSEDYQKTLGKLIANQNALRGAMNATTASMQQVKADALAAKKGADGLATSYNGLVNQLAALKRELRSVDTATDEGMAQFAELAKQIDNVNNRLKLLDAYQGNYQRNVGNYSSALSGLNMSMSQVVRELPSAAVSMNTFFLAISNNIPILVDQINNLRAQNKQLIAQGKQGISVIGAVAKSFFSWNTVLTLVITAVTLFGDDLIKLIGNLFKTKDAVDVNAEAMKAYKEAVDSSRKAEAEATVTSSLLYRAATDMNRSMEDRLSATRQLQSEYPDYFKNFSEEEILAGKAKSAYDELTKSLVENARAKAYLNAITEEQSKIVDVEIKRAEAQKQLNEAQESLRILEDRASKAMDDAGTAGAAALSQDVQFYSQQAAVAKSSVDDLKKTIQEYNDEIAVHVATIEDLEGNIPINAVSGGSGTSSTTTDNTLQLQRQAQDAQIALMEEGMEKELLIARVNNERKIEDLKMQLATEKDLTAEGITAINDTIVALSEQGRQDQLDIVAKYNRQQLEAQQKLNDELAKEAQKDALEFLKAEEQRQKDRRTANGKRIGAVDDNTESRLADNRYDTGISERERADNEYNIIQEGNQRKLELIRQFAEDALEAGDLTAYLDYQQQAADMSVEIEKNSAEKQKQIWDNLQAAKMQAYQNTVSGVTTLLNTLADLYEEDAENSEEAARQSKNLQIAATTISTISGAVSAYMGAIKAFENTGPGAIAGPIVGAVQAAMVLATGMAQIAKIRNTEVDKDKESSGSISATVSAPTVTPRVTEVRNITSASEEDRLNRMADDQRVYILASDIEASQKQRRVRVRETSF